MFPDLGALLRSDGLLGLLLVFITFVSIRALFPYLRYPESIPIRDTARAAYAFSNYEHLSKYHLARMRNTYLKSVRSNPSHKRISIKIGYPEKLRRLEHAIQVNAIVTRGISRLSEDEFRIFDSKARDDDLVRVRESLKHFVRDWSAEGKRERDEVFTPILDVLTTLERDPSHRENRHVLIPGSGLGRLAWEVSRLRFNTTANERSSYMNLAFRFLLTPNLTSSINQHTIHPHAHWFSHQRINDSLFKPVTFPDSIPRLSPTFHLDQGDFFDIKPPQSSQGYSYIITLFFIDTSLNIIRTIQQLFSLLEPGGVWINLGPLLWTSSGAALELSLDEVLQVVREVGFELLPLSQFTKGSYNTDLKNGTTKSIACEYTSDQNAMMRWIYHAELWVARKPL